MTCSACGPARAVRRVGRNRVRDIRCKALGGIGGVSLDARSLIGTGIGIAVALVGGALVYGMLKAAVGLRLDPEEEFNGSDLSIHRIPATTERESGW